MNFLWWTSGSWAACHRWSQWPTRTLKHMTSILLQQASSPSGRIICVMSIWWELNIVLRINWWFEFFLSCIFLRFFEVYTTIDLLFHLITQFVENYITTIKCINSLQESIKPSLRSGSEETKAAIISTLWTCVEVGLRVLSPFMPFLTEELYQRLPCTTGKRESIMLCDYPLHNEVRGFSVWGNLCKSFGSNK